MLVILMLVFKVHVHGQQCFHRWSSL